MVKDLLRKLEVNLVYPRIAELQTGQIIENKIFRFPDGLAHHDFLAAWSFVVIGARSAITVVVVTKKEMFARP